MVVFVPLTIYSLHLQTVQYYDPSAIKSLALCSEAAKIMSDLHDGADFYARVLGDILILAQRYKYLSDPAERVPSDLGATFGSASHQIDAEVILPEPGLHSLVMRLNGLALALGRVPDIGLVMLPPSKPFAAR